MPGAGGEREARSRAGKESADSERARRSARRTLFEKPSLRTISTFEIAVRELGGDVITPFPVAALSEREPAIDVARNLERWVQFVVMRTFAHSTLLEFAKAAPRLHVINALSDHRTSLPGAGRSSDAPGSLGRMGGSHDHVRGGRQQRGDVARARRRHAGHDVPHRLTRRLRTAGLRRRAGDAGRAARRADSAFPRSRRGRQGRGRGLHRCLDVDGTGSRSVPSGSARSTAIR